MKKLIALVLVLVLLLCLAACGNKLVEGSEKTYYGTVTDRTSCAPTIETIVFARDLGIIRGKLSPQLSHLFAIACFYITG